VLVEVARKAYIASIVPVIVNAILNEHQIVVDIVAFVNKGDFPRSRLGEKQRGKILAGWVSRKMRTMAQFAIKDNDREALGPPGTSSGEQPSGQGAAALDEQHRASLSSFRSSSGGGPLPAHAGANSSLRNVEPVPQIIPEQRELEHNQQYPYHQQQGGYDALAVNMNMDMDDGARTPGPVEMPADDREISAYDNEQTPTKNYMSQQQQHQQQQPLHVGGLGEPTLPHGFELPEFDQFGRDEGDAPPPAVGPKPGTAGGGSSSSRPGTGPGSGQFGGAGIGGAMSSQTPPQIRLPGVDGRESLDDWELRPGSGSGNGSGAGKGEEDDWTRDAYMSMNLAGTLGGR
jgi:hypothetical protein